jgi:hypothetical protein
MSVTIAPIAPIARPAWRAARLWLALAAVVALGALLVATLSDHPGRPLDIGSAHKNGSRAVARLLEQYGAHVSQTTDLGTALAAADSAIVVTAPDEYSGAQLGRLTRAAARVVFARPGERAAAAIAPGLAPALVVGGLLHPFCADAGAVAAGPAQWPDDTVRYVPGASGTAPCYDNALLISPRLAVLGSADVLRNDRLADEGVAAMDVNVITDSRRLTSVVWLLPGTDAGGSGSGAVSVWDLFPEGTGRVFWWVVVVGALLVVWRARRLGAVVSEPLPVVVRAAELVEGHGRLYARAGARDRAAAALRSAAATRLAHRLGLPRGANDADIAAAAAPTLGRRAAEVNALLAGAPPADDAGLVRLAADLDELEAALGGERKGYREQ